MRISRLIAAVAIASISLSFNALAQNSESNASAPAPAAATAQSAPAPVRSLTGDPEEKIIVLPGVKACDCWSRGGWTYAVFAGGGTGLNDRSDVQFAHFGVRGGRVLTTSSGQHWHSGSLEYNAEFMPYTHYFWKGQQGISGFAFNPVLVKWNFTGTNLNRKLIPFFEVHGGFVKTTVNLPPGDTADINFTSGAGVGANYFVAPNRAVSFDIRALHLSNASIGRHNPGINASLQWTLGYTWYKR
jgi:hypothetical protein